MKKQFKSRKEVTSYLKEKGIDTSNWSELKWLSLNKGQAEIHMMALAESMWDAMNESTPKVLQPGEWHIPFNEKIHEVDCEVFAHPKTVKPLMDLVRVKIATAMAARTSYTVVGDEKEFGYEKQIELHDRMANQVPFHASPFEHCARAMHVDEYSTYYKGILGDATSTREGYYALSKNEEGWCRNFKGFIQYREILETSKTQENVAGD